MQNIGSILEKLAKLAAKGEELELIDLDIMLDHTKVLYSELLEYRDGIGEPADESEEVEDEEQEENDTESEIPEDTNAADTNSLSDDNTEEEETPEEETVAENSVEQRKEDKKEDPSSAPNYRQEEQARTEEEEYIESESLKEIPKYDFPTRHDIRDSIGINDKYLYINELFGGNTVNYENMLDELNKRSGYDEAMAWLKENILFSNQSESEETAQSFYETLNSFFSDK